MEYWWMVTIGYVTEEDIKMCTMEEHDLIDQLYDSGTMVVGKLDKDVAECTFHFILTKNVCRRSRCSRSFDPCPRCGVVCCTAALYAKNLVYFTVPIADDDKIYVPPLEGFVMNRVLGDYFENLLYKIFVTIDAHTSVKDLASLLRQDPQLVKDAVSAYCRLGCVVLGCGVLGSTQAKRSKTELWDLAAQS
jgi:hypothetical protein